jgi:predicted membrane protein
MPIVGEEPYEEDIEWLKYGRQMIQESPNVLDEAAKSFMTMGSSLLTVYTGALALFKLNERASDLFDWTVICIPIILWLLCISSLAWVYFPNRLRFNARSPSDIANVTMDVSRKKSLRLKIGSILFVMALAATSISILWLGAGPAEDVEAEEQTIHLLIIENEDITLKNRNYSAPHSNLYFPSDTS